MCFLSWTAIDAGSIPPYEELKEMGGRSQIKEESLRQDVCKVKLIALRGAGCHEAKEKIARRQNFESDAELIFRSGTYQGTWTCVR